MTEGMTKLSSLIVPFEGGAGDVVDWATVESAYGTEFPSDYKEFVRLFGHGTIEGRIATLIPVVTSDPMVRRVAPLSGPMKSDPGYQRWTEPRVEACGLDRILVWGETDSSDVLGWITGGPDPDAWPLAVWARGDAAWTAYSCGMVAFLVRLLRGEFVRCPISDTSLVGVPHARFLHDRVEERLANEGVYPWDD
ncbi:hypothetical protein [Streptomyces sp. SM13]|uniref:hypothetical protein n=1 Tax=Streptomyces sp. SM13 TaxID=1983803 RepID=UPI000CD59B67|nr:hypothetical protein [Streptomyces sp. SM13]